MNAGRWGGLAGAPLGALVHLAHAWVGAFQEPVLTGAALAALLRLAAALSEVFRRDMQTPSASVDVEGPASSPYCLASAARGRPQSGASAAAPGALGSMPALLPRGAVQQSPSKEVQAGSAAGLLKIKDSSKRVQMPGARPTQVRRAKSLCTRLQPGTAPHVHLPALQL